MFSGEKKLFNFRGRRKRSIDQKKTNKESGGGAPNAIISKFNNDEFSTKREKTIIIPSLCTFITYFNNTANTRIRVYVAANDSDSPSTYAALLLTARGIEFERPNTTVEGETE